MFCPKCGTENPDTNKYCRSCRESLLVVAQAMKKRLPVMIVSKLDAALERLSERFRRDCFLWFLFGVGGLIAAGVGFSGRAASIKYFGSLFVSVAGFSASLWSYLAFKRSLMFGERLESGDFSSGSVIRSTVRSLGIQTLDLSEVAAPLAQSEPELRILFCPACGAKAQELFKHCRSCGADLKLIRAAVKPSRWRAWLNYRLDRYIETRSDKSEIRERAARGKAILGALGFLPLGIMQAFDGHVPVSLLLGCVFLLIAVWDYYASRRWFPTEEKRGDESQVALTDRALVPATDELALPSAIDTFPMSITEETTRHLEPVFVQSQEEVETRKL